MELKHITRAEWVAALRSGKYKQAKGSLKDAEGFCCLSVACDLAGLDWDLVSPMQRSCSTFVFRADMDEGRSYPALNLFADMGLTDMDTGLLATHNDRGDSFAEIAAEIEAMPVRVIDPEWLERNFPHAVDANAKAVRVTG